jgi:hypothetical protein
LHSQLAALGGSAPALVFMHRRTLDTRRIVAGRRPSADRLASLLISGTPQA